MKRLLFIILMFVSIINFTNAKNRTANEALTIANSFLKTSTPLLKSQTVSNSSLKLIYTELAPNQQDEALFYIFNRGSDSGFVIVSGDDRANTILGYSDTGNFSTDNMPENLKFWLNNYKTDLQLLKKSNIKTVTTTSNTSNDTFAPYVLPLLQNIKWNQHFPFNKFCPLIDTINGEKAITGCVATAMAQVMKYHSWPIHGTGSHSYTTKTYKINLDADFSQTTYDWENMKGTYYSESTDTENNAVATLMYHCGIAVDMDYTTTASYASKYAISTALINYFGYDPNIHIPEKNYYTNDEWLTIIKQELNANRPILYSGIISEELGHEFICDGYDTNNLVHINWGWGGIANGYFALNAFYPYDQGFGSSIGGYNGDQYILTGVQKPTGNSAPDHAIVIGFIDSTYSKNISRDQKFNIDIVKVHNKSIKTFSGEIGIALFNGSEMTQLLFSYPVAYLPYYYGLDYFPVSQISIPASVPDGNYELHIVSKSTDENDWYKSRGLIGTPYYLNVYVNSTSISFESPSNQVPQLTLNSLTVDGSIYENKVNRYVVNITNNGCEYNSKIQLKLQSTLHDTVVQTINTSTLNISTNETRTINFIDSIKVEPGDYKLSVLYDPLNNISYSTELKQLGKDSLVNVKEEPTLSPELSLVAPISFTDPDNIFVEAGVTLSAKIKNSGGYFDKKIIALIYPATGGYNLAYFGDQNLFIDNNEEKLVTFNGSISLDPGNYFVDIDYLDNNNYWNTFTPTNYSGIMINLKENTTSLQQAKINNYKLYPNPTSNILNIESEDCINSIKILNVIGEIKRSIQLYKSGIVSIDVTDLESGSYFLKIETKNNAETLKFIKQ